MSQNPFDDIAEPESSGSEVQSQPTREPSLCVSDHNSQAIVDIESIVDEETAKKEHLMTMAKVALRKVHVSLTAHTLHTFQAMPLTCACTG